MNCGQPSLGTVANPKTAPNLASSLMHVHPPLQTSGSADRVILQAFPFENEALRRIASTMSTVP